MMYSWMKEIPDNKKLTEISIPGTHDSCAMKDLLLGFLKTQHVDLPEQFERGIRYIDLRVRHYKDGLYVHHERKFMKNFSDVIKDCVDFLKRHPTETILMSFEQLESSEGNTESIKQSFVKIVKAASHKELRDVFYTEPAINPPIKHLRGKIMLLPLSDNQLGVEDIIDNIGKSRRLEIKWQNQYDDPGGDKKFIYIINHLDEAVYDSDAKGEDTLYVNYASAVAQQASGYSKFINPKLSRYLKNRGGRVGIIALDYFEAPPELVPRIIKTNFSKRHWWATRGDLKTVLNRDVRIKPFKLEEPICYWEVKDSLKEEDTPIQLWEGRRDNNTWKIKYVQSEDGRDIFSIYNPSLDRFVTLQENACLSSSARMENAGQRFLIREVEGAYSFHVPKQIDWAIECEDGNLGNSTKIQFRSLGNLNSDEEYRTQWSFEIS